MPVPDILKSAADYLQAHGWIQGDYAERWAYDDDDNYVERVHPPCCAAGAIGMAAVGVTPDYFCDDGTATDAERALLTFAEFISCREVVPDPDTNAVIDVIGDWNDRAVHTRDEVIDALRKAAKKAENQ